MIKDLGLLAIVFALVPGYIADLAFRAWWGMAKGDEFDRSLRAIIWSIVGLSLYAASFGKPPNFITALVPGKIAPAFDWFVGVASGIDVFLSSLAAFSVGGLTRWDRAQRLFIRLFGRSPTSESPWDAFWTRYDKGRAVRVVLKDGKSYVSRVFVASHRAEERELVMLGG